jgi:hypothetical protein
VTVTGTGGSGGSGTNIGIYNSVSIITSGGIGTVTVTGNGGSGGNIPYNWARTAIESIAIVLIVGSVLASDGASAALASLFDFSAGGGVVAADVGAAAVAAIPEAVAAPTLTMQEMIDAGLMADEDGMWTIPLDAADASFEWISVDGLEAEAVVTEAQERATLLIEVLEELGLVDSLAVYKTELSTVTADSFTPALPSSTDAMTYNASVWTVGAAEYVEGRTTNSGQGVGEAVGGRRRRKRGRGGAALGGGGEAAAMWAAGATRAESLRSVQAGSPGRLR